MEGKVILLIIVGTIAVMLMAFSVVFFVLLYRRKALESKLKMQEMKTRHQEDMLSATLRSQEEERNRLGSELHDGVGAMLSSIKLNLQVAKRKKEIDSLPAVLGHLDETISQVRGISHQMMPIILKKYGLKRAIEDLFSKVSSDNFHATLQEWGDPSMTEANSLMLYRIIQELVNNSIKHSGASHINLSVVSKNNSIQVHYEDTGKGYPVEVLEQSEGMGLLNIKNRAQAIGAKVHFCNTSDGGAAVNLVIDTSID